MMTLPPAAAPARPRSLLVATSLVVAAGTVLMGTLLGIYLSVRVTTADGLTTNWLPSGVEVPQVAAATLLSVMAGAAVVAQWARYAVANDDRSGAYLALGLLGIFGVAALNAQVYIWAQMGMKVADGPMPVVTYAVTGVWFFAAVAGLLFTLVVAFRALGGRYSAKQHEGVSALSLYWLWLGVAFGAIWTIVYLLK
jgi:cytochrome c oxidase subunit 3